MRRRVGTDGGVVALGDLGVALEGFLRLVVAGEEVVLLVGVLADSSVLDVGARQAELALGETHAAEELDRVFPLLLLSLLVPVELAGHDVDDHGQRLERGLSVEEGEACAAGEDVYCGLGGFVAHRVTDLTVDEGVELRNALAADGEALVGRFTKCGNGPGSVTVSFSQVLGDFSLETKVLNDVDEKCLAPAVSTKKSDLVSLAGTVQRCTIVNHFSTGYTRRVADRTGLQAKGRDGFVNSFLGHLSVSGPLTTRNGDETAIAGCDEMVTDETFGLGLFGVADKRTDTRPGGKNITAANIDFRLEVVLHLVENPLDFFFASNGVLGDLTGSIGSTSDSVALPWEEEDDTTIRSVRINQAHVCRREITGENNVYTRRGSDNFFDLLVVHLADSVGEGTSCVDDTLGSDGEFIRLAVGFGDYVLDASTIELAVRIPGKACDFDVVDDRGAVKGGGHGERDVHAGVVVGTICVGVSHLLLSVRIAFTYRSRQELRQCRTS